MLTDKVMRYAVAFGGISIIIAITLIFVYLLMVVFPIFESATIEEKGTYAEPATGATLYLAMEEQNEVALQVTEDGLLTFFDTIKGKQITEYQAKIPADTEVTSFAHSDPARATIAFGLSNGQALLLQHKYKVTFPENKRLITPEVLSPLDGPVIVDDQKLPLTWGNVVISTTSGR